ncbi:MAG: Gfo/Idh/MocA family oxidoreductase [Euryarchaeota archaeon]|nr:Gfo/Idh/MocA family oxidoreductase [Euryarchaeota archaeon]
MLDKYRVGIIGCGRIASLFEEDQWRDHPCTHVGAYSSNEKTKIVAAADINTGNLRTFSQKWGIKSVYSDYKEMLEREELDIVSVAANTVMHHEIVTIAAKSGVKAIFCEKPIATSLREADEIIKICEKKCVKLTINHTRRWDPYYQKIKELINDGKIGEMTSISGYFTSGLLIMGTHMFDMLRFLAGDVDWIAAAIETKKDTKDNQKNDPSGSSYFQFKNGVIGSVIGSSKKQYFIFEIDIQGTMGRVKIWDDGNNLELWTPDMKKTHIDYNTPNKLISQMITTVKKKNYMISAIEDVIESIERNEESLCTGYDGMAALELSLACHKSAQCGGSKISLPLQDKELRVITR